MAVLKMSDLILNRQYKHGPSHMRHELPILTLVFIGEMLVVLKDRNGIESAMSLKWFLEYAMTVDRAETV